MTNIINQHEKRSKPCVKKKYVRRKTCSSEIGVENRKRMRVNSAR